MSKNLEDGDISVQEREMPFPPETEPSPEEIKLAEEIGDKNEPQFAGMQESTVVQENGIEEPEEERGVIIGSEEPEVAQITAGASGSSQLRISGGSATESAEPEASTRRRWASESQTSYSAGEGRAPELLPKKVKQDCLNTGQDPVILEGPSPPTNEKLRATSEPPNQISGDKEENGSSGSVVTVKKAKQKRKVKVVKTVRTGYTTEERQRLYGNGRFVVDVEDIGKPIENILIWQIEDETHTLRRYYPAKYQKQQFFVSRTNRWTFAKKDFKSDSFFQRFQPIVVVETPGPEPPQSEDSEDENAEKIVQFVYIDKPTFQRMTKFMGKIHLTEGLRETFMDCLPVPILVALHQDFMFRWYSRHLSKVTYDRFREPVHAWETIYNQIEAKLADLMGKCGLSGAAWRCLITFPNFQTCKFEVEEDTTMECSGCKQLPRRPSSYLVSFPVDSSKQQPYNRKTLERISLKDCPPLGFPLTWCKECTEKGRKLHRLMHFLHFLVQLKVQNVALDIKTFLAANGRVTDAIVLWIHNRDVNWKNQMFLDFQLILAETDIVTS